MLGYGTHSPRASFRDKRWIQELQILIGHIIRERLERTLLPQ